MASNGTQYNTLAPGKQAQIVSDLQDLFRSNSRGYGLGEFEGAKFKEDKNKWIPGGVRWVWGATTTAEWNDHLAGVRLLGQGVLCDDNRVWYACLDVDIYEIDYMEEMSKIKRSGLPLIVFRTKSGGLRVSVFFNEAIEADLVITRMRRVASILGYAKCEIFPKQATLLVDQNDCPSWIYMPFGGTHDIFAEQGCMNPNGSLMALEDAISHIKDTRISKSQFMEMFAAEEAAKANGKANGKNHPKGAWIEEESEVLTINTMFHDGPPCLWYLSKEGVHDMQNNYLLNVSTFLKKKYPENWDKALEWVNYHVLKPVGDREKLASIIKRMNTQDYEYMCSQEPIASRCFAHACRRMPYGVGTNGHSTDFYDMGMTIINRVPQLFIVSMHDVRMTCDAAELLSLYSFKVKCLAHNIPFPPNMKKDEWERIISLNVENATRVDPSPVMVTNSYETGVMRRWFSIRVPTFMRVGERGMEDRVRVDTHERRIYFKWTGDGGFGDYCRSPMCNVGDYEKMTKYIEANCVHHKQEIGSGIRGWWRGSYSISIDVFDEETVDKWLSIGQENQPMTEFPENNPFSEDKR